MQYRDEHFVLKYWTCFLVFWFHMLSKFLCFVLIIFRICVNGQCIFYQHSYASWKHSLSILCLFITSLFQFMFVNPIFYKPDVSWYIHIELGGIAYFLSWYTTTKMLVLLICHTILCHQKACHCVISRKLWDACPN